MNFSGDFSRRAIIIGSIIVQDKTDESGLEMSGSAPALPLQIRARNLTGVIS
jgi:hypothetical protein